MPGRNAVSALSDARRNIRASDAVAYAPEGLNKREKFENLIPFKRAAE